MIDNTMKTNTRANWARPLRYLLRIPLLLIHVVAGLPFTLLFVNPLGKKIRIGNHDNMHQLMIRWWSRGVCRIFGFKVRQIGQRQPGPCMLLANHVSWLDIEVIHSIVIASFVAKAEIERWPLIGWMAKIGGTIFHHRGSGSSLQNVSDDLAACLNRRGTVAIFPEGKTGTGEQVLPFHGRLLQAAITTQTPIQPVALRYMRDRHCVNHLVAFSSSENFMTNLIRVLGDPVTTVETVFLDPIIPNGEGRRQLAHHAHQQVAAQFSSYQRDA